MSKDKRVVVRADEDVREVLQMAANCLGVPLSSFILQASVERAYKVIEQAHTIKLTFAASEAFFKALENPPKANEALMKAAAKYKDKSRS